MPSKILDGKALAQLAEEDIKVHVSNLKEKGITPTLATILVGLDPASATYVKMKQNACARLGMDSIAVELSKDATTQELLNTIEKLNADSSVHGILLQHPVPSQISERQCFDAINAEKDVDGVTCIGFGQMTMGEEAFGSCTPAGIMRILEHYKIEISGKNAVVVGRSPILGKPMAMMLLNANASVTICHSRTANLQEHIQNADILVGAVGVPRLIQKDWIKNGAVVIDAGYHPAEKCGDIDLADIDSVASAHTPVPGGVGPMTINTLILNTLLAAQKSI